MPALPEGDEGDAVSRGIIDGIYRFSPAPQTAGGLRASILFSGPMWRVAREAQELLADRWSVAADTWAVTSWAGLRADALDVERWNRLHADQEPRHALVTDVLGDGPDPVVAITDYMRSVPDQVARFLRLTGDRRLRPLRRPGRLAALLRSGRRPSGDRRAQRAGPERAPPGGNGGQGHGDRSGAGGAVRGLSPSQPPDSIDMKSDSTASAPGGTVTTR
jgi:hypothetical protein